jgi:predicted O-methyltransferase YrrM
MAVFEYGSGHSTLWWARHVEHVASVEHDLRWVESLTPRLPPNVDLRFEPLDPAGRYARSAADRGRRFDVLVIDGEERNESAYACLPALKADGVIIWDNSDWTALYADGLKHLEESGFRRIDFRGLGPLYWRPWTTSIFYRPGNNCFQI